MGLFLRTQDFRFKSLKDYNFQPNYITISDKEIGVLRIHYVDEGKRLILLLYFCMVNHPGLIFIDI